MTIKTKFIHSFVFLMVLFFIPGCGKTTKNINKVETYDQFRTQQIETRDSLFILYTVKEWSKLNWYTFEDYSKMYKMTNKQVEYFIGGTFYSPDKKKILVWVGEKVPNAETLENYNEKKPETNKLCPDGADTIYTLSALIGVRDSINTVWKLYPFNQQQATCYSTKEEVLNVLGEYYFKQMKTHQMYRIMQGGKRKGYKESQAYGYNLQDKDFWDKSWLFKKDTVGSYGLYPFQIYGYDYSGDKCNKNSAQPYKPPALNYPPEILRLYK
jgi:hypothetical protein